MNKTHLIKKIAHEANISIDQATKQLQSFENAIKPRDHQDEINHHKSFIWRNGTRKKGGKFKYERK